jgi:hypothetical protein
MLVFLTPKCNCIRQRRGALIDGDGRNLTLAGDESPAKRAGDVAKPANIGARHRAET